MAIWAMVYATTLLLHCREDWQYGHSSGMDANSCRLEIDKAFATIYCCNCICVLVVGNHDPESRQWWGQPCDAVPAA